MIEPTIAYLEKMMGRALALARKGIGKTTPNPPVGCVIVNGGEMVGTGRPEPPMPRFTPFARRVIGPVVPTSLSPWSRAVTSARPLPAPMPSLPPEWGGFMPG